MIDPQEAGTLGRIFFYSGFFLSSAGVLTIVMTLFRRARHRDGLMVAEIGMSLRHGVLLALLATILLFFQDLRILVWWDATLVAIGIFLIELRFLIKK